MAEVSYHPTSDASYLSRRSVVFLVIVVVHVFAIWAFATGLARSGARYLQTILQTNIIQTEKPKDLPPPPPPVDLKVRPPVQVIAPDINITVPVETPPPIRTEAITAKPVVAAVKPPPPPPLVWPPGWSDNVPSTEDYYPPASTRANEEGRPVVHLCVQANGRLQSVALLTGSGYDRLDQAALALIKATPRFKPPTQGGKPLEGCRDLAIKFQLKGK